MTSFKRYIWTCFIVLISIFLTQSGYSQTSDLVISDDLSQGEFEEVIEDVGTALSFQPVEPALTRGYKRFRVGVAVNSPFFDFGKSAIKKAFPREKLRVLTSARVMKSFDFGATGVDLTGFLSGQPLASSNVKVLGAAGKITGFQTSDFPTALRLHISSIRGVDKLDLNTLGLDVTSSYTFYTENREAYRIDLVIPDEVQGNRISITPYGGLSFLNNNADKVSELGLSAVDKSSNRLFGGIQFGLGVVEFSTELQVGVFGPDTFVFSLRGNVGL